MSSTDGTPPPDGAGTDPPGDTTMVRHVLVVDDDPVHRLVIGRVAQKIGYTPVDAATVAEAARLLAEQRFACVTLDLNMGSQSGVELLDVLNEKQPNVPVVVVSAADDQERWNVLRVATLYGLRVSEVPKPLAIGRLQAVFAEIAQTR